MDNEAALRNRFAKVERKHKYTFTDGPHLCSTARRMPINEPQQQPGSVMYYLRFFEELAPVEGGGGGRHPSRKAPLLQFQNNHQYFHHQRHRIFEMSAAEKDQNQQRLFWLGSPDLTHSASSINSVFAGSTILLNFNIKMMVW